MPGGPPLSAEYVQWQCYQRVKKYRCSKLRALPFCQLHLVVRLWKGRRILMLKDAWEPSHFCWMHLVAMLSKGRISSMLEADRGPSPFCQMHLVVSLSNVGEYRCLRALPFLLIAFGGEAIQKVWISMLEADKGPSPLSTAFGNEAIKGSETIDACMKLIESSIVMNRRILMLSMLEVDGVLNRDDLESIDSWNRLSPPQDNLENIDTWICFHWVIELTYCVLTAHIQYHHLDRPVWCSKTQYLQLIAIE